MVHVALDKETCNYIFCTLQCQYGTASIIDADSSSTQLCVVAPYDFLIAIRFEIDAVTLQLEITFNNIIILFILFIISTEVLFYISFFIFIYKINLNKNLSSSSKQAVIIYLFFACILHLLLVCGNYSTVGIYENCSDDGGCCCLLVVC